MSHPRWIVAALSIAVLPLAFPAHPVSAGSDPAKSVHHPENRDGWSDTRAGEVARGWVESFSTGEAAMRDYYLKWMAPESLAKKSMDQRMEVYRTNRERFGKLVFASVVKSTPGELTVSLLDADAAAHDFTFAVQTAAPFKLLSVSLKEMHPHFGFHH